MIKLHTYRVVYFYHKPPMWASDAMVVLHSIHLQPCQDLLATLEDNHLQGEIQQLCITPGYNGGKSRLGWLSLSELEKLWTEYGYIDA